MNGGNLRSPGPTKWADILKRDAMCYVVLIVVILHLLGVLPGVLERIAPSHGNNAHGATPAATSTP